MNLELAVTLPFPLALEGYPPLECSVDDESLIVRGHAGSDLFVDPAGNGPQVDAGRLLGSPPPGDFALSARVGVDFLSSYDAGVLLVYLDATHWAKLCFEYSPQGRPSVVSVVTRGTSDDCNSFDVDGNVVWLRISRVGTVWAFHASTDGTWWRLIRYFSLTGGEESVRVGLEAQSPTGAGCTATFDELTFTPNVPGDLRNGT